MVRPDPVPTPRQLMLIRFRRVMRLLAAFSTVMAATAVLLVMRGEDSVSPHMMIATALGVGLTVLLGTGLMALVFLSSRSGHDEEAGRTFERPDG